jgi:hypothetical protein
MQSHPAIFNPIWPIVYPIVRRGSGEVVSSFDDNAAAFSKIYADNIWGSSESASGWGSTLAYTAPLRKDLSSLLASMSVRSFLDAPCGDFHWMSHVGLPEGTLYIGGDIVPDLIAGLRKTHAHRSCYDFRVIDIVKGPIPAADLWLCRDVLFHLPIADGLAVLRNFADSEVPFLLTTTYDFVKKNFDTRPGGFRYINLREPPFGLAKPRLKIADFIAPAPPRYLALWSREEVRAALAR